MLVLVHTLKIYERHESLDKTHEINSIRESDSYQDSDVDIRHHYIRSMNECRTQCSSENIETKTKVIGDLCAIKCSIFDDSAWKTLKKDVLWYALLEQDFNESQ